MSKAEGRFEGFPPEKQTWDFPTLLNGWVHKLSGAEFKVLWYIVRHTFGWQKTEDSISYTQFMNGIQKKDGTWLDRGTGLSRQSVSNALKKLEELGFIERIAGSESGKKGVYRLRFMTSLKSRLPQSKNLTATSLKIRPTISNNQSLYIYNSLSQDIDSVYSEEARERLLSELKKIFPRHPFSKELLLSEPNKVDYLLWKAEKGEIKPKLIKSPLAYIKSLTIGEPFPSILERERAKKKKEQEKQGEGTKPIDFDENKKRLKHLIDGLSAKGGSDSVGQERKKK